MRLLLPSVLALVLAFTGAAQAAHVKNAPAASPADSSYGGSYQPDLVSFGVGYMNFDKTEPKTNSADFRLEYRFGYTFIGGNEVGFHPTLGYEMTSRNLQYYNGGFAMDWNFHPHGVFTWSEAMGYLSSGDQRSMGGTFQFRSQAEIGYRFDNNMRVSAEFSHISNAKLTHVNPGAEIIGMYVHVPTAIMFGPFK